MDLNNAAAIVTGGASGLGEATARMLAARGAKVAIFDLNEELGEKIASELGGNFSRSMWQMRKMSLHPLPLHKKRTELLACL